MTMQFLRQIGEKNVISGEVWASRCRSRNAHAKKFAYFADQSIALKLNSPPSLIPDGQREVIVFVRV